MKKLVGGKNIDCETAFQVVKQINKLPIENCECYRYAITSDDEIFVIFGNSKQVNAITFQVQETFDTDGTRIEYLIEPVNIGYANLHPEYDRLKEMHIMSLHIQPPFRNKGVGSQILKFVESYAKKHRYKCITLDCLNTYTNGEETVVDLGNAESIKRIIELREKGVIVNKNLRFYLKNEFKIDDKRHLEFMTPMIKTKLKYHKPDIYDINELVDKKPLVYGFTKKNKQVKVAKPKNNKIGYGLDDRKL